MSRNTHSSPKQRAFRDTTNPSVRHRWTLQEKYTHAHVNEKHHFKLWGESSLLQKNAPLKMFHCPLHKSSFSTFCFLLLWTTWHIQTTERKDTIQRSFHGQHGLLHSPCVRFSSSGISWNSLWKVLLCFTKLCGGSNDGDEKKKLKSRDVNGTFLSRCKHQNVCAWMLNVLLTFHYLHNRIIWSFEYNTDLELASSKMSKNIFGYSGMTDLREHPIIMDR